MKPVVILGSGGHAKCVIDILRSMGGHEIVGCIYDDTDPERIVAGVPIIDRMARIETLGQEGMSVAIGLGAWTDTTAKRKLFERAAALDLDIVTPVDPAARIASSAVVGRGTTIFAGVDLAIESVLGENVVLASNTLVSHETVIEDHVLVAAGVNIGGNAKIGRGTLVAIGATIASRVSIGRDCLVCAGSVVVEDVPDGAVVRGVPARQTEKCAS